MADKKTDPVGEKPTTAGAETAETIRDLYGKLLRPILAATAVALAILAAVSWYSRRKEAALMQAARIYWEARSAQELESIPEDYPRSPLASPALLKAAKERFDNGEYPEALKLYLAFQEREPGHLLFDTAHLGELHSREMLGQIQEALRGFEQFATTHPDHPLTPQAILGQARCMETMGLFQSAHEIYTRFIEGQGHEAWKSFATKKLSSLQRKMARPAVSETVPVPVGDPVAPAPAPASPTVIEPAANEAEPIAEGSEPMPRLPAGETETSGGEAETKGNDEP